MHPHLVEMKTSRFTFDTYGCQELAGSQRTLASLCVVTSSHGSSSACSRPVARSVGRLVPQPACVLPAAEPRLLWSVPGAGDHLLGHARHVLPLGLPHGRGRDTCGLLELIGGHRTVAAVTGYIACIFTLIIDTSLQLKNRDYFWII